MRELETARFGNLFATPVLSHLWTDSDELNAALRIRILDHARRHPGAARTNMGGWHSEPGLLEFCGEGGAQLISRVDAMVKEATLRLYAEFGRTPQRTSWTLSAWANVNQCGDYNQLHTHPGATWSGVYYVDHGEAHDAAAATAIHLYDPNPARANLFFPELSTSNIIFKPEPGLMILFPSYVPHEVPPHHGERERITIAFNLRREQFS